MESSAYIRIECDKCGSEEEIELCALAHSGSWDDRYVEGRLKKLGWKINDYEHYCPDCQEDDE